ncbi:hypothetical protein [Actinacidiphila glaucinigra]|uniref:hypothetical protein n=1 Tax=Actinacidiphila glaucinigra TaxID=235986 RepID=UPI0035D5CB44
MNSTIAGTLFPIPGLDSGAVETPAPAPQPEPAPLGMRPAAARIVTTDAPDMHDPERRPLVFLVVNCPFCEQQHIHTGGHPGALRLCLRRSRCVGRPAGVYHFPEVQQ